MKSTWAATWQNQQNECAPSEDSDQPQSDQSSLCAQWVAKDPRFLHADSEDSDQTGRMSRLIWVFAGRTLILLVLSYRGSHHDCNSSGSSDMYDTRMLYNTIWAATCQNQQNGCVPSEDSDQPGHPPNLIRVLAVRLKKAWVLSYPLSLIRVLAVRMKKAWVLSYPLSAQRRLWADLADAQADLSVRWAHTHLFVLSCRGSYAKVGEGT